VSCRGCCVEWEGKGSGAVCGAGGALPSGKAKNAVLCGAGGALPSEKVKKAVLCGAGGAMASGKVKEVVLFGAGGAVRSGEGEGSGAVLCMWCRAEWGRGRKWCCLVQVVPCRVGR
jgi:hypothetical protein